VIIENFAGAYAGTVVLARSGSSRSSQKFDWTHEIQTAVEPGFFDSEL